MDTIEDKLRNRFEREFKEHNESSKKNPFNVPEEIRYFCKIHEANEVANYIGTMGDIPLFNTPDGHTLSYERMMLIVEDECSDDWWNVYKG